MLDTRQLRYFAAVCDHLHFTRAADALNIAQSALSAQIKRLEQDLGVSLFQRNKRSAVKLTQAGDLFLIEVRQVLLQVERAERVGRLAARGVIGRIDIGHIASAVVAGTLAEMLTAYRSCHPEVVVNLSHMETPVQLRALAEGTIDVAFVRPRAEYPAGVAIREVSRAPLMLALPAQSALANATPLRVQDLRGANFIIPQFTEGVAFATQLERLTRLLAKPVADPIKVGDFLSALVLVAAGYGVVLIPGYFDRLNVEGVVLRPIAGFVEEAVLMMAWRDRDRSPAIAAFLQQTKFKI